MSMNPVSSIDYIATTVVTTVKWGATAKSIWFETEVISEKGTVELGELVPCR